MEEMSRITHPESSEEIRLHLNISDENQNKLKETETMDFDNVKHDLGNGNTQALISHSCSVDHGSLSGMVPPGPSPSLLASLQSLVEDNDHMLLPHSLHKIAEAYFLEEDYHWAAEFLTLERLYHERLVSNLASIQEQWVTQWNASFQTKSDSPVSETEKAHLDSLSHICKTHQRPNLLTEKNTNDTKLQSSPAHVIYQRGSEQENTLVNSTVKENRAGDNTRREAEQEPDEGEGLEEDFEEDEYWNEELQEETAMDGQVPVDELAKLIQIEEMFPSNGLVSILKKRACVKGTESLDPQKTSKRKVRFREPDDAFDQGKPELKSVEVIVADVAEPESLAIMCKQGVIVLNCVGPYRFYGEPVVKACLENGAHCIDICGEPQFLEGIQLNYHSAAQENGVYIIGSCGFDSVPADMGILYTRDQFKGTLTAVESFLTVSTGPEGGCGHDATWRSAIFGFADSSNLRRIRKKFGYKPLPVAGARVKKRGAVFFSKEIEQYAIPFMGSDPSVVRRTQRYLYEEHKNYPVQYMAYVGIGDVFSLAKTLFAGVVFWFMVKFGLGRRLLTQFPKLFSFGMFSKSGPSKTQMKDTSFCMSFIGEGYTTGHDPSQGKPNARISTEITGPELGYIATPITMVQAAITLLNEPHSLPKQGGVYTPGSAFAKTTLIDRLNKHGIMFTVQDEH
ncbi:saccharopine dehydrogenase-like oxidoreductase isoform X2 [Triplophysa dalaica]|uniref:saccharopine dehydrogenase-like oxidoreductase isoform X2 n=1 Tax=Triplophysa dalaica TaxID=1582913 RepID=UPI0024DFECE7|nr:saccharopine dehydrogenase-like oxidoreductase isoform X2 [Triplophysa dalaica]